MADIKQAAKWMNEGKKVRCKGWTNANFSLHVAADKDDRERIYGSTGNAYQMDTDDLLARDWEIAE